MHAWQRHPTFGGHVVLDFVNTVDDEHKTRTLNALPDWPTTLDWAVMVALINENERTVLAALSENPEADTELSNLLDLKEGLWQALHKLTSSAPPHQDTVAPLANAVRWGLAQADLHWAQHRGGTGIRWVVSVETTGLETVRARMCVALADLLARQDLSRLRECGRCTGLYLNHGRGAGRRWCRMETCGNRAKVERFRKKA